MLDLTLHCSDGAQVKAHKVVVAAVSELVEKESFMKDEVSLPAGHKAVTLLVDYCYTQMIGPFTGNQQVTSFNTTVTSFILNEN